jgi:hypothetical protein
MLRPFLKCLKELDLNDAAATSQLEVKRPEPPGPSKGLGVLVMQQQPLFRSNGCKVSRYCSIVSLIIIGKHRISAIMLLLSCRENQPGGSDTMHA